MEGNTYHGNGQYTYVSGDVFKGSFDESLPTGPAQYTTSQGEVIDGVWQDGLLVLLIVVVLFCFVLLFCLFCLLTFLTHSPFRASTSSIGLFLSERIKKRHE